MTGKTGRRSTAGPAPRLVYDDLGAGEPAFLLLPGWCEDRAGLRPLAERLARRRRVLLPDWRGHGESEAPVGAFGFPELLEDALAVVRESGAGAILPVAVSHAGWLVPDLRRRLGAAVGAAVLLDWLLLAPPPAFHAVLTGLQHPQRWRETREALFRLWLGEQAPPAVVRHVREEMGRHRFEAWARAAHAIAEAYRRQPVPLESFAALDPPLSVLHLYAQPPDAAWFEAQQAFAARHPWFRVRRLEAATHFPALEAPDAVAAAILEFVGA